MKECKSTKLETLVVKQKNNGTICVSMFIYTYSRKPQVNDFHVVISHSTVASWSVWCIFTCSELYSLIKHFVLRLPRSRSQTSQCVWWFAIRMISWYYTCPDRARSLRRRYWSFMNMKVQKGLVGPLFGSAPIIRRRLNISVTAPQHVILCMSAPKNLLYL